MSRKFFVDILMGGVARVKDLLDPVDPQDAATKAYVDANSGGGGISTFTEAVTNDPLTDITGAETETLTDGSNADLLHNHSELHTPDNTTKIVQVNNNGDVTIGENDEIVLNVGLENRIRINDVDTNNSGEFIINNTEMKLSIDPDNAANNSQLKVTIDGNNDLMTVNGFNTTMHLYNSTRDDGVTPYTPDNLYVDSVGRIQKGAPRSSYITNSGRIYGYSNERWIAVHDDLYGSNYYQYTENGGTGINPITEWEHNGIPLHPGAFLKSFTLMGRTNNTQYTDLEISIVWTTGSATNTYASGIDADGEDVHTEIFRGFYSDMVQNLNGVAFAGTMADKHMGLADINFEVPEYGEVRLYVKPVGNLTATRYFYGSWTWEIV